MVIAIILFLWLYNIPLCTKHDLVSHSGVHGPLGNFQFEDIIDIVIFNSCDM